jgi:hypothetical protein
LTPSRLGPLHGPECLAFSPDAQWLFASKEDGETVGWNLPLIRQELVKLGLDWTDPARRRRFSHRTAGAGWWVYTASRLMCLRNPEAAPSSKR